MAQRSGEAWEPVAHLSEGVLAVLSQANWRSLLLVLKVIVALCPKNRRDIKADCTPGMGRCLLEAPQTARFRHDCRAFWTPL